MKIIKGDATVPVEGYERVFIMHCCNNVGAWGAGFVVPLGQKYPRARTEFLSVDKPQLGRVIFAECGDVTVANIIGQHGLRTAGGQPPVRYAALREGFRTVRQIAGMYREQDYKVAIQFPKMGCGLAGGDWSVVSKDIESILDGFDLYLVDL